MYAEDPTFWKEVERGIQRFCHQTALIEDLRQEAIEHLAQVEAQSEVHTRAWCRTNCLLYARNLLRAGCSIDSPRHRNSRIGIKDESAPASNGGHHLEPQDSFLPALMTQDSLDFLSTKLHPGARVILGLLRQGYAAEEISRKLHISHQAVSKQISIIRRTAAEG
jgi:DNA-binding NarL/FixJ family response regulator